MNSCSYWAAGHITTFFKIADSSDDLLYKGSCGAGFNIKRGVIATVSNAPSLNLTHRIYFNGSLQSQNTTGITDYIFTELEEIIQDKLPKLEIKYDFQVPIGSGYGTSASAALTTVFAINSFLDLHIPEINLWQIAHKAEIANKTGLGDILGMYSNSKFELRIKEGAPGIGIVKPINFQGDEYDLYTLTLGPLSKKNILSDPSKRKKIIEKGLESVERFQRLPTFDNFCEISLEFTKFIDLLPRKLQKVVDSFGSSIKCSQIMLGESLYFFVPRGMGLPDIEEFYPVKEDLTEKTLHRII